MGGGRKAGQSFLQRRDDWWWLAVAPNTDENILSRTEGPVSVLKGVVTAINKNKITKTQQMKPTPLSRSPFVLECEHLLFQKRTEWPPTPPRAFAVNWWALSEVPLSKNVSRRRFDRNDSRAHSVWVIIKKKKKNLPPDGLILKKHFEEHTVGFYELELQEPDFRQVVLRFYRRSRDRVVQRVAGREDAARIKFSSAVQLTLQFFIFFIYLNNQHFNWNVWDLPKLK